MATAVYPGSFDPVTKGHSRQRGTRSPAGSEPSQALRASSPEGGAKGMMGALLASPFERLPPGRGKMSRSDKKGTRCHRR